MMVFTLPSSCTHCHCQSSPSSFDECSMSAGHWTKPISLTNRSPNM